MLGRDSDSKWTTKDRTLALALTDYEATLCPSCGFPKAICSNDDNDGEFEVRRSICYATATIEEETKPNGEEPYKPDLGEKLGVIYVG